MKCTNCKIDKLSNEFPSAVLTERCDHVSSHCLRCLIDLLKKQKEGEYECPECKTAVSRDDFKQLTDAWEDASFKLDVSQIGRQHLVANLKAANNKEEIVQKGDIYVVLLNGERIVIDYSVVSTVLALRQQIYAKNRIEIAKQKLVYNGVELMDYTNENRATKLVDYGIRANSHIQLIVILYEITQAESVKNLVFDLDWGFPANHPDYLDGTCFLYTGNQYWRKYDYQSVFYPATPSMRHSGDVIDNANKRGHHKITAKLDELPLEVTLLFFILSSWDSPTIGHFKTPKFHLFDQEHPDKNLCSYELKKAANTQAVIMCCVARTAHGMWNVIQVGAESAGNAKDYTAIERKIETLGLF
ncbi:5674_t:CDS:2 [Paraglomus occultum]|uniref:5674_t:CDS:1 n=1 Tax=Paraglomus occultum TaxID=144539 RepID=A0A9N9AKU0_9GLOM|nr:5674_t:CDS:2 [Paraglomus occultum]